MKFVQTVGLAACLATQAACATVAFEGHKTALGAIYADTHNNEEVTEAKLGTKQGISCATSILGLVTTGDASVATVAKSAGISQIASVDHSFNNILGIYSKYCVIVSGD